MKFYKCEPGFLVNGRLLVDQEILSERQIGFGPKNPALTPARQREQLRNVKYVEYELTEEERGFYEGADSDDASEGDNSTAAELDAMTDNEVVAFAKKSNIDIPDNIPQTRIRGYVRNQLKKGAS